MHIPSSESVQFQATCSSARLEKSVVHEEARSRTSVSDAVDNLCTDKFLPDPVQVKSVDSWKSSTESAVSRSAHKHSPGTIFSSAPSDKSAPEPHESPYADVFNPTTHAAEVENEITHEDHAYAFINGHAAFAGAFEQFSLSAISEQDRMYGCADTESPSAGAHTPSRPDFQAENKSFPPRVQYLDETLVEDNTEL